MRQPLVAWVITVTLSVLAILAPLIPSFEAPAWANPVKTDHAQVQLISEVDTIQPGVPFWVALRFEIQPNWHTYWRNPGDSGAAPIINWTLPSGFDISDIVWPYPERLSIAPLLNFGYTDQVLLLSQVTPPTNITTESIDLQADADWIVCKVACIPEQAVLDIQLPIAAEPPRKNAQWSEEFQRTRQALPQPSPWPITAALTASDLVLHIDSPELGSTETDQVSFFPEQDGVIVNAANQQITTTKTGLTLKVQRGYLAELDTVDGVLVIQETSTDSSAQAFTINADVAPLASLPPEALNSSVSPASPDLWQVFALAGLGGLVLNLMPCVFPVLSLKALNLVQKAQHRPQHIRWQALAFTSGILVSFAVIAGSLLLLRAWGQQIGWGFQLQSPAFVMVMAYLMFGIGLNLSGVYVFGARFMGLGQPLTDRAGYRGEFFTGVFATVVATPCTAPFMATAIGVALTQPVWVALAIFQTLGLGFALPYALISVLPGLQRRLPKPGAWMETLQQFLAFPMYMASAWLVWVLTQQTGTTGLAAVLAGLICLGFAAWVYRKSQLGTGRRQQVGTLAALAVLVFALTLSQIPTPVVPSTTPSATATTAQDVPWEPYSTERLSELNQMGKPVFIDFTADWCITCLVNKQVALNQPEVISAFAANDVTYLKADWTSRDRTITTALESFGRSGVPLYVLYSSNPSAEPTLLPQLLSAPKVIQALEAL